MSHHANSSVVQGASKDLLIDQIQEIEQKQSTTRVQDIDGFKFKTTLHHGVRNYEVIDESKLKKRQGPAGRQHADTINYSEPWEQLFDLEQSSHFLGEPAQYLM